MNNLRRKAIREIIAVLYDVQEKVEELLDEETDYKENIPENLQSSDRYYRAEECVDNLQTAYDSLDEVFSCLESAME